MVGGKVKPVCAPAIAHACDHANKVNPDDCVMTERGSCVEPQCCRNSYRIIKTKIPKSIKTRARPNIIISTEVKVLILCSASPPPLPLAFAIGCPRRALLCVWRCVLVAGEAPLFRLGM